MSRLGITEILNFFLGVGGMSELIKFLNKGVESGRDAPRPPFRVGFDHGGLFVPSRRGKKTKNKTIGWKTLEREFWGAISEFSKIVELIGPSNAFFIKRAADRDEERYFHLWLERKKFYKRTFLEKENVCVCKSREDKVSYCIAHGINVMVDDRYEVFDWFYRTMFGTLVTCVAFRPDLEERARYPHLHGRVIEVNSWKELRFLFKKIVVSLGYDINNSFPVAPGRVSSYVMEELTKLSLGGKK